MENILDLLKEVLENYEQYRIEYVNYNQDNLIKLRNEIKDSFLIMLSKNKINRVKVETNNGEFNNPPLIDNFNIAFLENKQKISRGIYCGIDFNKSNMTANVYLSTSHTNMPNKKEWEPILINKFIELNKHFEFQKPFEDQNHNWRYFVKTFSIETCFESSNHLIDFINSILVAIYFVRLLICENKELVEKYLNVSGLYVYRVSDIIEHIEKLKNQNN